MAGRRWLPNLFLGYFLLIDLSTSQEYKDQHDAEVKLKADLLRNYTIDVLPPHTRTSPIRIKLGLSLISLRELDARTQTLTTEGWLKLNWNDSRLSWNPDSYAGLQDIKIATHKIWQPDLQLYNSAKLDEMEIKGTGVFMIVYSTGGVVWIPPVTLSSLCPVDLRYYPYDVHKCKYKFGSWTHAGDHLDIESYKKVNESMDLSDFHDTGEWVVVDSDIAKTYMKYECCNETYPDVTFTVTLRRRSPFYRVTIVCPIVAAAFLILTSFWLSPMVYHRITLNIVSFLTVLSLLIHLSTKLPAVGNDSPIIMSLCAILLIISALITTFTVFFMSVARMKNNEQIPEWMKKLLQSRITTILCITATPSHIEAAGCGEDYSATLVEDDIRAVSNGTTSNSNAWVMFFQIFDRISFIICLIIIISVLAASSA